MIFINTNFGLAEHLNEGTTQLALKDVSKKDFLELLYQVSIGMKHGWNRL